jgi:hypothetical protein
LLAVLAGCASAPPEPTIDFKSGYNFRNIKTIAFMPQSGSASGDSPRAFLSDMVVGRIDEGIASALRAKGFQVIDDPKQADALVHWHLVAQEKTDIRTYNTGPTYGAYYGGYRGYNRSAFYNCWNCGTDVRVRQYTQGTFIVDIIDPKLEQSVFRSVVESRLKGEQPSREQAEYNAAAARILKGFPPPGY